MDAEMLRLIRRLLFYGRMASLEIIKRLNPLGGLTSRDRATRWPTNHAVNTVLLTQRPSAISLQVVTGRREFVDCNDLIILPKVNDFIVMASND